MASIERFLEQKLHLQVNQEKSAVAHVAERKFLGYRIIVEGRLAMAPESLRRAKDKIRQITKRNRGIKMEAVIHELNAFLIGWVIYFRHARCFKHLTRLDKWIRRRLRCYRLKQRKRAYSIAVFLQELGVPEWRAWLLAQSGKGWWRMAGSPQACEAMGIEWFDQQGLTQCSQHYKALQH